MTALDNIVSKIRPKNPQIAAGFDEVQRRLTLLERPPVVVPPDTPPTTPPAGKVILDLDLNGDFTGPTSFSQAPWLRTTYPGGKSEIVADPRGGGGRVLRLRTAEGDTSGPSGHAMAAIYVPNGLSGGEQGLTTLTEFLLYFAPDYKPAPNFEMPFFYERHISDAIPQNILGGGNPASCSLGCFSDSGVPLWTYRREGGDPNDPLLGTWDNPQTGWWQAPFTTGLHIFAFKERWDVGSGGGVEITHNGVVQTAATSKRFTRLQGPMLFKRPDGKPDSLAGGIYNYGPGGQPQSDVFLISFRVTLL